MSKYTKLEIVEILKDYAKDNDNEIDLSGVDFSGIDINFENAKCDVVGFKGATIKDVDLRKSNIQYVDLEGAIVDFISTP